MSLSSGSSHVSNSALLNYSSDDVKYGLSHWSSKHIRYPWHLNQIYNHTRYPAQASFTTTLATQDHFHHSVIPEVTVVLWCFKHYINSFFCQFQFHTFFFGILSLPQNIKWLTNSWHYSAKQTLYHRKSLWLTWAQHTPEISISISILLWLSLFSDTVIY